MKKAIMIVGLPACGKSALGMKLVEEVENSIFFDDLDNSCVEHVRSMSSKYDVIIIASTYMCVPVARDNVKKFFGELNPKIKMEWKYFDYNVNACINNCPEKKKEILEVAEYYEIPERTKKLRVEKWIPKKSENGKE